MGNVLTIKFDHKSVPTTIKANNTKLVLFNANMLRCKEITRHVGGHLIKIKLFS